MYDVRQIFGCVRVHEDAKGDALGKIPHWKQVQIFLPEN